LVIIVGAEKVPREIFEFADYNVGIGCQPHSEISALPFKKSYLFL